MKELTNYGQSDGDVEKTSPAIKDMIKGRRGLKNVGIANSQYAKLNAS